MKMRVRVVSGLSVSQPRLRECWMQTLRAVTADLAFISSKYPKKQFTKSMVVMIQKSGQSEAEPDMIIET